MKKLNLISPVIALAIFSSCDKQDEMQVMPNQGNFTVTIENIGSTFNFLGSGVFNTPLGDSQPGPATPGKKYEFSVNAGRKQKLSFVTMLASTNDLFFGPDGSGISLYDENGDPISGDVTEQVYLWDAGTEVNEEPAVGANTVGMQSGPDTGMVEDGNVLKIEDVTNGFAFDYPPVNELIKVSVTHRGGTEFSISIEDLVTGSLSTSQGEKVAPISPGVYVIHSADNPLFTEGEADRGQGVEAIAEDGNPSALGTYVSESTGVTFPASPGVWVVHSDGSMPVFAEGMMDYGDGIEHIAEDGNTMPISSVLASLEGLIVADVMTIPQGQSSAGPILPGMSYQFSFIAEEGDRLSFATMLAATNDVFIGPGGEGIALFDSNGLAKSGDITNSIYLWDAGTELNEQPAIGPNTVTNQLAPDTGIEESQPVRLLSEVNDGFSYPSVSSILKITVTGN